jgi:replicative DNA helicase
MISRISGFIIRDHKIEVCEQIERAKAAGFGDFHIKRMRESTTTSNEILSYCNEVQDRTGKKIDFVVSDYLDLMATNGKTNDNGNMFLKDKIVAEELRAVGFDLDAIMISASQLGRGALVATREERKIEQDHIQGGISKINTSDLAIAMVKDEALDAANEYRFDIVKSRNSGGVGKSVHLGWDPISLRISNIQRKQAAKLELKIPGVRKPGDSDDGLGLLG